ncbi:NAD-dependent epimerase/dehydratase family protein [Candidatus Micrarchaeota archaeon]|nr:NAD-dependent epimerase/dehydratase family protein [Candidatus Micrarchaeota archaeon]MBU1930107.1 NAD-dependent epimerase/dehydratase family protein [Candidatus Micrarchaeota archaeon]
MSSKTVLVTGSSGTIGTAFCEQLLSEKTDFIGIDQKPNQWNKSINQKTILADLRKTDWFEKIPVAPAIVVHLAAHPFVFASVENPQLAVDNTVMVLNVLEYCRQKKVSQLIFASSREVYGNNGPKICKETDVRIEHSESPYAASKIAGEAFVTAYQKCFGIDFVIVRFSNVYGRFDITNRLIPLVISKNKKNEDIIVFGEQKELPFTFIDDTALGLWRVLKKFDQVKNQSVNIASSKTTKIVDVVRLLQTQMKTTNKIHIESPRIGEVIRFQADVSKAQRLLGFEAKTSIQEGIRKTILWYNKNVP